MGALANAARAPGGIRDARVCAAGIAGDTVARDGWRLRDAGRRTAVPHESRSSPALLRVASGRTRRRKRASRDRWLRRIAGTMRKCPPGWRRRSRCGDPRRSDVGVASMRSHTRYHPRRRDVRCCDPRRGDVRRRDAWCRETWRRDARHRDMRRPYLRRRSARSGGSRGVAASASAWSTSSLMPTLRSRGNDQRTGHHDNRNKPNR